MHESEFEMCFVSEGHIIQVQKALHIFIICKRFFIDQLDQFGTNYVRNMVA